MLVLSRKKGESVVIDDNIEIKILETKEGKVKLGISAPKDVSVVRKEVLDVISENKEAGKRAVTKSELADILKNTLGE